MKKEYYEGVEAGKAGAEFWDNPYAAESGGPDRFLSWLAGWCAARSSAKESA